MIVNNICSTDFKSRNKTIRYADDIARQVNKCYPRISPSIVDDFKYSSKFRNFRFKIKYKLKDCVRGNTNYLFDHADSYIAELLAFIKPVKKYKLGNCGESAHLAAIIAHMNGIKNFHIASLVTSKGKNLDHSVIYVNDVNPYIIDAWLGFADYSSNAKSRFRNEYSMHFDKIEPDEKLVFEKIEDDLFSKTLNKEPTRRQLNKLKKILPNHVINRNY